MRAKISSLTQFRRWGKMRLGAKKLRLGAKKMRFTAKKLRLSAKRCFEKRRIY